MSDTAMLPLSSERQEENQSGPSENRPKRRESVDPEDIEPMKIINVIVDCLERVFDYLNVTELNNVAAAHPRLVTAARSVYRRKYNNQRLLIRDSGRHLSIYNYTDKSEEIINATATSFLRNFGELVKEIQLDYKNNSKYEDAHHWREVEGIIATHCTKTLTSIIFANCRGNVMEEIQKPFEKVVDLRIRYGFTEPAKVDLNNIFRNVRNLSVNGTAIRSAECLEGNFPFLKHIQFDIFESDDFIEELYDIAITFGKLKNLRLNKVLNMPKWNEFIMQNKKLTSLHYIIKKDNNANVDDLIRLMAALPILKTFKFATSSISPADLIQFLKACEPFQNLKTIGQVIPEDNLQNFISGMENIMDDEVKRIYKGPIKWEKENNRIICMHSPSVNFNRKFN